MVATLLRLKFSLVKNPLKREKWTLVSFILGGIWALSLIPLIGAGAYALSLVSTETASLVVVLAGSVTVLGWCLLPLLVFGSDETLDPARFATLNVAPRQLSIGLLLSGFIGIPGIVTGLLVFAPALAWIRHPGAAVAAVVMAPIAVLSCFAFSRLVTTVAANSLRSRRGRDAIAVFGFIALIGLTQIIPFLSDSSRADEVVERLRTVAAVSAWTPLGAPWAVPYDILEGGYLVAFSRTVIAVGALILALWAWSRALQRAMISSSGAHASASRAGNSIAKTVARPWARWGGASTWAIAARCLRYWRADPRYLVNAASVVILPAIALLVWATMTNSDDETVSVAFSFGAIVASLGPVLAFIMGWGLHNDIGSDSTAYWTHVSTGVSGRADRAGRIIALSLWFVPYLIAVTVALALVTGQGAHLPAILGAAAGIYLVGSGVSAVTSALLTYPVARPGDSPFSSRSGVSGISIMAQMVNTLVVFVISIPLFALIVADLMVGPLYGWLALAVGVLGGLGVVILGVRHGGAIYEARSVRLLAQVVKADA